MPKLIISDLKPGMRLLKPVTNPSGMVLLTEGLELTEELIDRLRKMEIESVFVRGGNNPPGRRMSFCPNWITVLKKPKQNPKWRS